MQIIAYGVQSEERPLLEAAFARRFQDTHRVRCLPLFLTGDTAATAAGHQIVLSSVNDTLDAPVLRALAQGGTRLIAQRGTGYTTST